MVSPRPSCISVPVSITTSPPSWRIATSNDTRVRVEGLSKIIASVLPASGLSAAARSRLSAVLHGAARLDHPAQLVDGISVRSRKCRGAERSPDRSLLRRLRGAREPRAGAIEHAPSPRRPPPRSTISGGSRRTTLSPAATASSCSSRSASTSCAVRHHAAQAEQQPFAAHFGDDVGIAVLDLGEPLLEQEADALARDRGSRRPASRRAPRCPPPSRADCRRRSSRACRRSCPCRLPWWRGRRRPGSRRRAPWRAP